ncbi:MAG: hypothetical protein ABI632_12585 [Pseudolysinimonas sp.]
MPHEPISQRTTVIDLHRGPDQQRFRVLVECRHLECELLRQPRVVVIEECDEIVCGVEDAGVAGARKPA